MSGLKAFIRPSVALLCGWLFAYLDVFNVIQHYLHKYALNLELPLALLLPLAVGMVATLTVDRRREHFIALAMLTGVLAVTGWYWYWYPGVVSADNALAASCHSATPDISCSHGLINPESHFATNILTYGWIISIILVLVSSSITGWLVKHVHKISPFKE